jgi:O-antigen ligase
MANRIATIALQAGLIAVTLLVLPYKIFELDRYFVPKELALHVVALVAAVAVLLRARTLTVDTVDILLAGFVAWSLLSTLFATNHWLAQRALGITVSSAIVFWAARQLGAQNMYRPILVAAAAATVCAAITCLAQAYGFETDYFSLNRAPGGTFGNRNFIAHFCAIGLPSLVFVTATARAPLGALAGSLGTTAVAAALVLSRSRAAWLALAATAMVLAIPLLASRAYWTSAHVGGRLARLALAGVVGGAAAIALPNRLNWTSDSPYLDSARGMVDYSTGSGRGRVAQYTNSLRMAASNPVFGVGPGNWPVRYVRFARSRDASLADDGMTANPWPSSDWAAFVSERGFVAAGALLAVFLLLLWKGCRRWAELPDTDAVLAKVTLIATITATGAVSAFDAVLLLPAPALLSWSVIGATSGIGRAGRVVELGGGKRMLAVWLLLLLLVVSVVRSIGQTAAINVVGNGGHRAGWRDGALWDPGSYRINLRLAQLYAARGQCPQARAYAARAQALFPYSPAPRRLLRCG